MRQVPYASTVGSLMYVMFCTRPDICYLVGMVSRYQSNPGPKHQQAVKHILKYLRRTRDYTLVYRCEDLIPIGYTDSDFQSDFDFRKSISGCVFTLRSGDISWSVKQSSIADSTMEAEYVTTCEMAKEADWFKKFLYDLGVVRMEQVPITLFGDNSGMTAQSKDPRNHKKGKKIERNYHIIRDIVVRGDVAVAKIDSGNNPTDPFTKTLPKGPLSHIWRVWELDQCTIVFRESGRLLRLVPLNPIA